MGSRKKETYIFYISSKNNQPSQETAKAQKKKLSPNRLLTEVFHKVVTKLALLFKVSKHTVWGTKDNCSRYYHEQDYSFFFFYS